tara:strand:+ start:2893 stop:4533 length:1641 start_codon:yes stop_codon:yes gene_type:complete
MRILLINFKNVFPKLKPFNGLVDYYQIGILDKENNDFTCRNNVKRLNQIVIEQREKYTNWIADLNSLFLKRKLTLNDEISLFYFTDLSNKRTEIFDTFNNICNIKFIEELVDEYNYEYILINGGDQNFFESIDSVINKKVKRIGYYNNNFKSLFLLSLRNSIIINFIRHLRLLLKYFIYKSILYPFLFSNKSISHNVKDIYFTRYPLHFKNNLFNEEKYSFLVDEKDKFLTSILCDGLHQNINCMHAIKSRIEILRTNNKKHIVIDDFIEFKIILKSLFDSLKIFFKFKGLLKIDYYYGNIKITKSIKSELNLSFQRILALILNYECLHLALRKINSSRYVYYLHEYAFGRMISYTLHKNKRFNTVGFQHGPASMKKILYFISKKEVPINYNYLNSVPIPNMIMAEDKDSKNVYINSGFSNIKILKKIPRLSYLYDLKLDNKRDIILIASGLHDFEFIYGYSLKIIKSCKNENFIFKPHPRSKNNFKKYLLPENAVFSLDHISKLLVRTKLLYASYSSVAMEAKFLNIPVKLINYHGIINESPLDN